MTFRFGKMQQHGVYDETAVRVRHGTASFVTLSVYENAKKWAPLYQASCRTDVRVETGVVLRRKRKAPTRYAFTGYVKLNVVRSGAHNGSAKRRNPSKATD